MGCAVALLLTASHVLKVKPARGIVPVGGLLQSINRHSMLLIVSVGWLDPCNA
jgi:hypothetical protein